MALGHETVATSFCVVSGPDVDVAVEELSFDSKIPADVLTNTLASLPSEIFF